MKRVRTYTTRYRCFCHAHDIPVGSPAGHRFISWISERWRQWDAANGRPFLSHHDKADHEAFDAWLRAWVGMGEEQLAHAMAQGDLGL